MLTLAPALPCLHSLMPLGRAKTDVSYVDPKPCSTSPCAFILLGLGFILVVVVVVLVLDLGLVLVLAHGGLPARAALLGWLRPEARGAKGPGPSGGTRPRGSSCFYVYILFILKRT